MNHTSGSERVGMAYKIISPKNQPQFSQMMMGAVRKTSPSKLSDWPEMLSKSCYRILIFFLLFNGIF